MEADGDEDEADRHTPQHETQAAIMRATYRALCDRGYANLTMQAIADEFDKSKAVIHYHYDTKEDLLVAFLEYLLENFGRTVDPEAMVTLEAEADPAKRLFELLEILLRGSPERRRGETDFDHWDLVVAMLEVRSAAPYNREFRRQLTTNFQTVEAIVIAILEEGIDRGRFRAVDPEATAVLLLSVINGCRTYQVTLEREDVAELVHEALQAMVMSWLSLPAGSEADSRQR